MYYLEDLINGFLDFILYRLIIPLILMLDKILRFLFSDIIDSGPFVVVLTTSVCAGGISLLLSLYFRDKNSKKLDKKFREKVSSLKLADELDDRNLRINLKKGINDKADEIYENILMDRFFNFGITYLFPMFFFLIWLDYSLFPLENKEVSVLNLFDFSIPISFSFIIFFNISLLVIYLLKKILYRLR